MWRAGRRCKANISAEMRPSLRERDIALAVDAFTERFKTQHDTLIERLKRHNLVDINFMSRDITLAVDALTSEMRSKGGVQIDFSERLFSRFHGPLSK